MIRLNFLFAANWLGLVGCLKMLLWQSCEYRKPKALPRVANKYKQAEFTVLYHYLMTKLPTDEAVHFVEFLNLEHQTIPTFGWVRHCLDLAVKTTTGHGRIIVPNAVCLANLGVPLVKPINVDDHRAIHLLAKVEAKNTGKPLIHVIGCNVGNDSCATIKKWLLFPKCPISLIQFIAYALHRNPIKRLWAVRHAQATNNCFYPTQKDFAHALLYFFLNTILKKWQDFCSQVSERFRIISRQNFWVMGLGSYLLQSRLKFKGQHFAQ